MFTPQQLRDCSKSQVTKNTSVMGNLKAAALKMIKTFITPEQIKEITADLMTKAIEEKKQNRAGCAER